MANEVTIIEHEPLVARHIAELDQQIATARAYPRPRLPVVASEIKGMATESEDVAQECVYALKRGGKVITGPSVRLAEIVAVCYGNAEYASQIIEEGQEFVTAQAVFRDLEKNIRVMVDVKRRIIDSNGNRYGIDMIGTTSMAAQSIAMRNAILKGVPRAVWGGAYSAATAMIAGTFESIERRRTSALDAFKKLGVDSDLVLQLLELKRIDEIEPSDIIILRGTLQAIRDGDTTLNATFGSLRAASGKKADVGGHLDKGKANGKAQGAKTEPRAAEGGSTGGNVKAGGGAVSGNTGEPRSDGGEQGGSAEDANGSDQSGDRGGEDNGADRGAEDADLLSGAEDRADEAGGSGAGTEGGKSGSGAEADTQPGTVAEAFLPFLKPFEGTDLAKLTNVALALSKAESAVKVAGVSAEFAPVMESAPADVEKAFTKMVAEANKLARKKGGSAASKL